MTIELSILLSVITVTLAVLTYVLNKNKYGKETNDKKVADAIVKAKSEAQTNAKLDVLIQSVSEMRLDNRETNKTIQDISDKLSRVESKVALHEKEITELKEYHH
jgi:peptidoglycan hydrolase CwlO-like protein